MNILITGASGFLGHPLAQKLAEQGFNLRLVLRQPSAWRLSGDNIETVEGDLRDSSWMREACSRMDLVLHTAGISHRVAEFEDHMAVNYEGTVALAKAASDLGVGRFVFVSSVAVYGVRTWKTIIDEDSGPLAPVDDGYGRSKMLAEQALREIERTSTLGVTVVRPPLVYGREVKGNLLRLMELADSWAPLPFGLAKGRRSMISVDNLIDFLIVSGLDERAVGTTFVVTDAEPVTVASLLADLKTLQGRWPLLIPVPKSILLVPARLAGRGNDIDLLFGRFEFRTYKAREILNWAPPYGRMEGLRDMVESYLNSNSESEKA